ncbi:outer membrane protein [Sulfurimonas xiamenensis]|uniref:Porin family protein n=1 Tax=Sulfurimonas xiamenensis TaxID=2590021 RepID=A0AAJ4A523_9BACT|nr:porin family protein [Sulfurimonas xiamenensis]QFR43903.1 porin family protein [Sulfurimonas xiamenensis]
MKNFTLSIATVLALSTFAVASEDIKPTVGASASESGFYIGGAYSMVKRDMNMHRNYGYTEGNDYNYYDSYNYDNNAYMLQAGYQFNQYIAIEGRYWGAIDSQESTYTRYINGELDYTGDWSDGDWSAWGIYIKPMYPVTETFSVYALLGYGNVSIDDEWYNDENLLDENVFQWGIGASYSIAENTSLFIDYVRLCKDEGDSYVDGGYDYNTYDLDISIDTVNIGLSYKF